MPRHVRKAVIPVAGMGTRVLPATKTIPKEMLPIVDKPLIQYVVEEGLEAGIEEFIFITSRGKSAIEDHFDRSPELETALRDKGKAALLQSVEKPLLTPGSITSIRQQSPLGLGHAIWCARNVIGDEPFAVLLPDEILVSNPPCLREMAEHYRSRGGNIVAVMDVPREHTNKYGIIDPGAEDGGLVEVKGMVEKPNPSVAPSTMSLIGRYILDPAVFAELDSHEKGAGGEIQLTDAMLKLVGRMPFHALPFKGARHDCGDKLGYVKATLAFAMEREDMAEQLKEYVKTYL